MGGINQSPPSYAGQASWFSWREGPRREETRDRQGNGAQGDHEPHGAVAWSGPPAAAKQAGTSAPGREPPRQRRPDERGNRDAGACDNEALVEHAGGVVEALVQDRACLFPREACRRREMQDRGADRLKSAAGDRPESQDEEGADRCDEHVGSWSRKLQPGAGLIGVDRERSRPDKPARAKSGADRGCHSHTADQDHRRDHPQTHRGGVQQFVEGPHGEARPLGRVDLAERGDQQVSRALNHARGRHRDRERHQDGDDLGKARRRFQGGDRLPVAALGSPPRALLASQPRPRNQQDREIDGERRQGQRRDQPERRYLRDAISHRSLRKETAARTSR